jgi:hypothetical protein
MNNTRLFFAVALLSVAALAPSAGAAHEAVGQPTDAEFRAQAKRLDPANPAAERLAAVQWLKRHLAAKNASLAVPALAQCIRKDADAKVRDAAVEALALIAQQRREPCPLAVVEAILDPDDYVSQTADGYATLFTSFAPGCVDVLLRCAAAEKVLLRGNCLFHLAVAAGKDPRVLQVLEKAKGEKSFWVRHNAHAAFFRATDNLEVFLTYLVRLREDPDGVLGKVDANSDDGKRERAARNLALIGSGARIVEWSDERADGLARALLQLLTDRSPLVRRGAARLVGITAVKTAPTDFRWQEWLDRDKKAVKPRGPSQPSRVAEQLRKSNVEKRLRELRDSDPDQAVRRAAATALEQFAGVWQKGK